MGTIKIKGYASREVNADIVRYDVSFVARDVKTSAAIEKVKRQCEIFLLCLNDLGFDASSFHLSEDKVNDSSYNNRNEKYAERKISFKAGFDARINNAILDIVKNNDLTVEIKTDYVVSDRKTIHKELLQEALLDSKAKAQKIAEANNQTVKYADAISDDKYEIYDQKDDSQTANCPTLDLEGDFASFADKLESKVIKESESLYVSWVIE